MIARTIPQILRFMYHHSQMRRALSIPLILFFSFGPLSALFGASEDASLPACCRRHGAHHCVVSMQMETMMVEAGQLIVTAPATCPSFPGSMAATTCAPYALTTTPMSLPALLAQPHSPAAGQAAARLSQIRTRAGRGPPVSSLA